MEATRTSVLNFFTTQNLMSKHTSYNSKNVFKSRRLQTRVETTAICLVRLTVLGQTASPLARTAHYFPAKKQALELCFIAHVAACFPAHLHPHLPGLFSRHLAGCVLHTPMWLLLSRVHLPGFNTVQQNYTPYFSPGAYTCYRPDSKSGLIPGGIRPDSHWPHPGLAHVSPWHGHCLGQAPGGICMGWSRHYGIISPYGPAQILAVAHCLDWARTRQTIC